MSDQPQRPATDDRAAWRAYWQAQGQPWRTEPEVDEARQAYLAERRAVKPDIEQGIYPFRDESGGIPLTRADVEWLLATHESRGVIGPVKWEDERGKPEPERREGLDVRGANLCTSHLSGLPLARLRGGLTSAQRDDATHVQRHAAAVQLTDAQLDQADLRQACLARVDLENADLEEACLEQADLSGTHLERASLRSARLCGAQLRRAFFDGATNLDGIVIDHPRHGCVSLVDVSWGDANLSPVKWSLVGELGDEQTARKRSGPDGKRKERSQRLREFDDAARANRQLAIVLGLQGQDEHSDNFAYRARMLQREVLRLERKPAQWLLSALLWALAGYGYRLWRILAVYSIVVALFAAAYYVLAPLDKHPLEVHQAVLVSLTSIHGRVFFEPFGLTSALLWVAAIESVVGIVIEGVFVAMLVQRFFAR